MATEAKHQKQEGAKSIAKNMQNLGKQAKLPKPHACSSWNFVELRGTSLNFVGLCANARFLQYFNIFYIWAIVTIWQLDSLEFIVRTRVSTAFLPLIYFCPIIFQAFLPNRSLIHKIILDRCNSQPSRHRRSKLFKKHGFLGLRGGRLPHEDHKSMFQTMRFGLSELLKGKVHNRKTPRHLH